MSTKKIIGKLLVNGEEIVTQPSALTASFNIVNPNTTITLQSINMDYILWGDGSEEDTSLSHTYTKPGEYTCKILNLTTIGNNAFAYCESLTSVGIPDSVTTIGSNAFSWCSGLTSVEIGNSVQNIEECAFYNCYNLTSVVIPDSVTSIGESAFDSSSLTSVVIPNSVTSIVESAFYNCSSLTRVTFKSLEPLTYYTSWFSNCLLLEHIYVPYGCKQAYIDKWTADGAEQTILDKIIESDREAMMSDIENIKISAPTISISMTQILSQGKDSYTQTPYIRFTPTEEQESKYFIDDAVTTIKLDLTQLGENAPASYVWIKRNTKVSISGIDAVQFTAGGEQFYYDNYSTDIVIKDIGNVALVYVPSLHICDISFASISIPDLYYKLGQLQTITKDSLVNNTETWTDEEKTKACETIGATDKAYVDGLIAELEARIAALTNGLTDAQISALNEFAKSLAVETTTEEA